MNALAETKTEGINDELLSEEASAAMTGVSVETLREYVRFGLLEAVTKENKSFLKQKDILELFNAKDTSQQKDLKGSSLRELREKIVSHQLHDSPLKAVKEPLQSREENTSNMSYLPVPANYELLSLNKRLRAEIQELKEERVWLRSRLEKLEARSEREQMLLLYESETVRTLVNAQTKGSNFWAKALPILRTPLEWLNPPPTKTKK